MDRSAARAPLQGPGLSSLLTGLIASLASVPWPTVSRRLHYTLHKQPLHGESTQCESSRIRWTAQQAIAAKHRISCARRNAEIGFWLRGVERALSPLSQFGKMPSEPGSSLIVSKACHRASTGLAQRKGMMRADAVMCHGRLRASRVGGWNKIELSCFWTRLTYDCRTVRSAVAAEPLAG